VTADHWGFVLAAYGLAAVVLTTYWRHLCRRERALRSPVATGGGHARPKPASRPPLP
jgi:hypothetical protein